MNASRRIKGASLAALVLAVAVGAWTLPSGAEAEASAVFTADISAQTHVKPYEFCTVHAVLDDGTPPYEYEWTGLFNGDDSYEQATLTGSGMVYLTVTDALDNVATDEVYITVDSSGDDCTI